MNKIEKWILDEFEDLKHEMDGTYDEMEQTAISTRFGPLGQLPHTVKVCGL